MPSMKITRSLRVGPSENSMVVVTAHEGDAVKVLETSGEFKKVRLIDVFSKPEGWVSASAVDEGEVPSAPVDKAHFAGECWTQAIFSGSNAHYLAAVGELRSRVVNDGTLETGLGLFRLLKGEWRSVWKDDEFGQITEDDLRPWRIQVKIFGLLARSATDALEKALDKRPTALQLLLAQLVGVQAFKLLEKDPTKTVKQALTEVTAEELPPGGLSVDGIIDRHARFLKENEFVATGKQVTEQIGRALDGALEAMRALVVATGAPVLDDPTDAITPDAAVGSNINFDAKTIPSGRKDVAKKIAAAFANAGFGAIQQVTALANAIRESNLNPEAANESDIESSFGLFQLNTKGGLGTGFSAQQLKQSDFNIDIIVKEAKKIPAFATVTSLIDAMTIFVKRIERPANQEVEIAKRLKIVETLLV